LSTLTCVIVISAFYEKLIVFFNIFRQRLCTEKLLEKWSKCLVIPFILVVMAPIHIFEMVTLCTIYVINIILCNMGGDHRFIHLNTGKQRITVFIQRCN